MGELRIVIVGAGNLGEQSARRLVSAGHQVTIVEKEAAAARNAGMLVGDHVVCGDGCDPKVLEAAGIAQAHVVAALTGQDEDNLVIAELAGRLFGVGKVLARVNRPDNEWLFTQRRGVDIVFNPAVIIADLVERAVAQTTAE